MAVRLWSPTAEHLSKTPRMFRTDRRVGHDANSVVGDLLLLQLQQIPNDAVRARRRGKKTPRTACRRPRCWSCGAA